MCADRLRVEVEVPRWREEDDVSCLAQTSGRGVILEKKEIYSSSALNSFCDVFFNDFMSHRTQAELLCSHSDQVYTLI